MRSMTVIFCFLTALAASWLSPILGQYLLADEPQLQEPVNLMPFQPGFEHNFIYDTQIASGLVPSDISGEPEIPEQKAVTRIQASVKIDFSSNRQAAIRLSQIEMGQLNDHIPTPERVKPIRLFQMMPLSDERKRQIELPAHFIYADGVIERIKFHPMDDSWSKNIKRGVLNMIQLNLKRNNAQGLVNPEAVKDQQQLFEQDQEDSIFGSGSEISFTIPERTVEGECQTMYTVTPVLPMMKSSSSSSLSLKMFNVTKSINYKLCHKIPDVAFGHQMEQLQPQCARCQVHWHKLYQAQVSSESTKEKISSLQNPCEKCDPKEIKEKKLERSTVLRFEIEGNPTEKYAIKRSEAVSNYVFKNLDTETGEYGSAMQTIVSSRLIFRSAVRGENLAAQLPHISPENDEQLMASNEWSTDEKQFFMYGDEEFYGRTKPFKDMKNKIFQAEQALQKIARILQKSYKNGIEVDGSIQMQKLVEILRMCSLDELKAIEQIAAQKVRINSEFDQSSATGDSSGSEQLIADALALAGTRNTIFRLVEMILNKQVHENKAALTLKSLINLPAPSDSQVNLVLRLCQNEMVHRNEVLKQSCWLTLGGMINEVCQYTTAKTAQSSAMFGKQSGFTSPEKCPLDKKQKYREAMLNLLQSAETTYDRILALKTIGNAGLDIMIHDLEELIVDKNTNSMIRMLAIESTRRLRSVMPRKIQNMLIPIFLNNYEKPKVRMVAFLRIMDTLPSKPIISQIIFQMTRERSKPVLSFVYNTLKSIAQSPNPLQTEIAIQISDALKMVTIDEEKLRLSGEKQIPLFNYQQNEGVFVNLLSLRSGHSKIPTLLAIQLNSMLNQDFQLNDISLSFAQRNIEQLFERVISVYRQRKHYTPGDYLSNPSQSNLRTQRYTSNIGNVFDDEDSTTRKTTPYKEYLRQMFTKNGFKSREYPSSSLSGIPETTHKELLKWFGVDQPSMSSRLVDEEEPIAGINLRIADVDQFVIPISRKVGPKFVRQLLDEGRAPSFSRLVELLLSVVPPSMTMGSGSRRMLFAAMNLNEKRAIVWTSAGIPITATQSAPLIAFVEGARQQSAEMDQAKYQTRTGPALEDDDNLTQKRIAVNVHPSMSVSRIRKLEVWLPVFVTGVQNIVSIEKNTHLNAEVMISSNTGVQIAIRVPKREKIRVFGLHTLPTTYVAKYDSNNKMLMEPKVKGIHNPLLEPMHRDIDLIIGDSIGLKKTIRGHYFRPSGPLDYKKLVQMLMATENHIHVEFEPNERTPNEIVVQLTGRLFEEVNKNVVEPAFSKMFNRELRVSKYDSKFKQERDFARLYKSEAGVSMFKHWLKMSIMAVGGPRELKADLLAQLIHEPSLRYVKFDMTYDRTSLSQNYNEEPTKHTWNTRMEMIRPKWVSQMDRLSHLVESDRKFTFSLESEWGPSQQDSSSSNSQKKSFVDLKVFGEQASIIAANDEQKSLFRGAGNDGEVSTIWSPSPATSEPGHSLLPSIQFLNKYTVLVSADFDLFDRRRTDFSTSYENDDDDYSAAISGPRRLSPFWWEKILLKLVEWSQLHGPQIARQIAVNSPLPIPRAVLYELIDKLGKELRKTGGQQLQIEMIIDPATQSRANFSIRTQKESEMFNLMPLKSRFRPLPLYRSGESGIDNEGTTDYLSSLDQIFEGIESNLLRSKCKVDGTLVRTFDNVVYRAPISNCYSVLAKDCSSEEPRFVVMMKKKTNSHHKKIRVITPEKMIECEGFHQENDIVNKRVNCRVNNQELMTVGGGNIDGRLSTSASSSVAESDYYKRKDVEFVGPEKSKVIIRVEGVSIHFNGKKVSIKISNKYKNTQCGLCGHYDDQPEDELRTQDDETTRDLAKFHRSYTLLHSAENDGECSSEYRDRFYDENSKNIRWAVPSRRFLAFGHGVGTSLLQSELGIPAGELDRDEEEEWKTDLLNSHNKMILLDDEDKDNIVGQSEYRSSSWAVRKNALRTEPMLQTRYKEFSDRICFSTRPVDTCPKGTYPIVRGQFEGELRLTSGGSINSKNGARGLETTQIVFTCFSRLDETTRRLLSQARLGTVLDLSGYPASFNDDVPVHSECEPQHY